MGEIVVNNTGSGGPISITPVGDEFIIAWSQSRMISCARFSGAGARLSDNFTVNDTNTPGTWPLLAHMPGGFVVLWVSNGKLLLQAFTSDGTKNSDHPIQVSADVDGENPPGIARQLDGSLVVTWGDAGQHNIHAQVFGPDLSALSNVLTVNDTGTIGTQVNLQPIVTFLNTSDEGSSFVIAWGGGPGIGRTRNRFRFYQADGTRTLEPQPPNGKLESIAHLAQFDFSLRPGALAPLPDGGFCGLFGGEGGQDGENVLMVDSYDEHGTHLGAANVTHRDDHTLSTLPVISSTPNNEALVVAWTQQSPHVSGDQDASIMAAMVSSDLQVLASIKINAAPPPGAPPRDRLLACVTPVITDISSNLAFAWVDESPTTPPPPPSLKARVFSGDLSRDVGPT